jgi:hypothetical protein
MSTPVRTLARVVVPWVDSVQTMLSTNRLPKAATERSKVSLSLARQSTSLGPGTALLAVNAMSIFRSSKSDASLTSEGRTHKEHHDPGDPCRHLTPLPGSIAMRKSNNTLIL